MNMNPQGGVANRERGPNAGVDVCKAHLDACWGVEHLRVTHDAVGWDALVAKFKAAKVDLIALECRRRFKSEPPCRSNIEPGVEADFERVGCG